jgi:hypothetical protein
MIGYGHDTRVGQRFPLLDADTLVAALHGKLFEAPSRFGSKEA